MNAQDIDLLEALLDGELAPAASLDLQARLEREADLASMLDSLQEERKLRKACFASFEPSARNADDLARALFAKARRDDVHKWALGKSGMFRMVGSIAACVLVGFGVGWLSRGSVTQTPVVPQPSGEYIVSITDENGSVIGTQKFPSDEQAQAFITDLDKWQKAQAQLRSQYMVVRSRAF